MTGMAIHRRDILDKPRWKDLYNESPQVPYISKGTMTLKVPITLFSENRKRLVEALRKVRPHAMVIIQAASTAGCVGRSSFVQDSIFFWAFGYQRSRAMGVIDVVSNKSYLIVSRIRLGGLEWCENQFNRKQIKKQFFVDNVWYLDELDCFLSFMKKYNDCREILILNYQAQDLPASIFDYEVDKITLDKVIRQLIAHKTPSEVKILNYIARNLEGALIHITERLRPGMTDNQAESWFTFYMAFKSDFVQLTFSILSGDDHMADYNFHKGRLPPSKRQKIFKDGELCVIEGSASYFGYRISLGIVIPVSENFNKYQRTAYEIMLRMRISICRELQSGVPLEYIQKFAEKSLIQILIQSKLLYGTVEGAFKHGIGKLLIPFNIVRSMEVLCEKPKELELGKTYLLQPGCYFTKRWIDQAFKDDVLKLYLTPELWNYENIVVKLSDPIIITTDGFRFLSTIPRAWCTINDMRLKDRCRRSEFTNELEKEYLTVKPESFRI